MSSYPVEAKTFQIRIDGLLQFRGLGELAVARCTARLHLLALSAHDDDAVWKWRTLISVPARAAAAASSRS